MSAIDKLKNACIFMRSKSIIPHEIPSPMQLSQIPHFQNQILIFVQSCYWIICQSSHTLGKPSTQYFIEILQTHFQSPQMHHPLPTHSSTFSKTKLNASAPNFYHLILLIRFFFHLPRLQSWSILFQPLSLKFTNSLLLPKANNVPLIPSQLSFWNSASMNLVQSSQILSISLFLKEFFHRHSNKLLSSLFSKNHFYPLMISTTFVQFQTSTSFPKFSKKLLPPAFNPTCLLTLCLLLFNLLTGSFILLKLLFLKFTMTSSLRWIVVRSLHSFFSTYLLPLILLIIPSFSLVFKIGLVLMVFLLIGFHLISHLALRQSQSMIPSLHFLLFPVVYPKVPYLAHSFSLSIQLLLARWS